MFARTVSVIFMVVFAIIMAHPVAARAADGKALFDEACGFCHALDPADSADMDAPPLGQIFNRKAGTMPGFRYSGAIRRAANRDDLHWTRENLDKFLAAPESFLPKTLMAYPGLDIAKERKAIIDYLKTLQDQP